MNKGTVQEILRVKLKDKKKKIEKERTCKFIRINPSRENLDITNEFCRIKKHIIKSTKKV